MRNSTLQNTALADMWVENKMKGDNPTERLQRIFAERWDKPFLTDGKTGETITYGKFIGISEKIKKFIVSKGAKQGDTVCTIMQNSPFSLAVIFAFLFGRIDRRAHV